MPFIAKTKNLIALPGGGGFLGGGTDIKAININTHCETIQTDFFHFTNMACPAKGNNPWRPNAQRVIGKMKEKNLRMRKTHPKNLSRSPLALYQFLLTNLRLLS